MPVKSNKNFVCLCSHLLFEWFQKKQCCIGGWQRCLLRKQSHRPNNEYWHCLLQDDQCLVLLYLGWAGNCLFQLFTTWQVWRYYSVSSWSRGVLRNHHGRVDEATESTGGSLGGLYAAGWIKRGPCGIIGTNISDAKDTVATIVHDLKGLDGKGGQNSSRSGHLKSLL